MAEAPRALEAPQAGWELAGSAGAARWLRANSVLAAGLLLIGAQLLWKAGLLGRSFFRLDDYFYLEHASSQGLTWSYLTWMNAGHLDVVGSAVAWVLVRISPDDWTLASVATLALLGGTCFALLRMLRTLFGDRPGILLLLTLYLLSPLSLPGLSWWSVALEQLPLQLAACCAVSSHVRYLRTGEFKHAAYAGAWLAVGMLSAFQGAAVPFLLFAVTSAFFAAGPWSRALWPALREHWRAWGLYAGLTAAYAALYLDRLSSSTVRPARPASFADALSFAGTLLRQTFLPGAFGGPWRWSASGVEALTAPPAALAWMSWVLAVAVVLASLMYAWQAWRAWAILAGWLVVADIVPVVAGRSSLVSATLLGLSARYAWDAAAIAVLCAGLAFLPLAGAAGQWRRPRRLSRPELAAASTVVTAVVFGSLWSFYGYPADPTAAAARGYLATARVALARAPAGTVIVDSPVPPDVTGGPFPGPVSQASSVLSALLGGPPAGRPAFTARPDGTYGRLLEFDGYGRLVPAVVFGPDSQPRPAGSACWPARNGVVTVRLGSAPTAPSTLRIGYLSAGPGQVLVTFGPRSVLYDVRQGLNAAYLPVSGLSVTGLPVTGLPVTGLPVTGLPVTGLPVTSLPVTGAGTVVIAPVSGAAPCIGDAQAGVLLPSAGPAVPPLAVSG